MIGGKGFQMAFREAKVDFLNALYTIFMGWSVIHSEVSNAQYATYASTYEAEAIAR